MSQTVQHFIAHHVARGEKDLVRSLISRTFFLVFILGIGSFLTIYFLSPVLLKFFLHATGTSQIISENKAVVFLAFASSAYIASSIVNSMILGFQRFRANGVLVILNAIASYGLAAYLVMIYGDPQAVTAGWAIAYYTMLILNLIVLARTVRKHGTTVGRSMDFRPVFKYTIPILLSAVVSFSSVYADRLIVAGLINQEIFAVYSFALLITSSVAFFVSPINNILLPKFSEYFSINEGDSIKRGIRLTTNVVTFIYTPIALWIAVLGAPIILVLGDASYIGGALPLAIILIVSAVFISQGVLVQGLQGIRVTSIFILSSGLSLLANLILSFLLIPRYALIGASIGYSSVTVINFMVIYYFARKFRIVSFDLLTMTKIWASSIAVFVSIFLFNRFALPLQPFSSLLSGIPELLVYGFYLVIYILLGLLVYALAIRITKAMNGESLDFFYTFVPDSLKFTRRIVFFLFVGEDRFSMPSHMAGKR